MDLQNFREVELFSSLDGVQVAHLASIVEERKVSKGTVLFQEGDPPEFFYVIHKGRVRISKFVSGFGEEALAILAEGTYFGEMELIEGSLPRAAHAIAHTDCVLQTFKISDFHELLNSDKELAVALLWNIVKTMSSRLRATDDKVAAMFAMAKFE